MARLSYSAVVGGLKVLLPLLALGLLSTLFLFARTKPDDTQLPYLDDLRQRAVQADGMQTPFYTGSTEAGDAVTIQAVSARPDPEDPARTFAEHLTAHIGYTDGSNLTIDARDAVYSDIGDVLRLTGNVTLVSSTGYELRTDELVTRMGEARAEAPGQVIAEGPAGEITSGGLLITRDSAGGETAQLVFTKGVKLIYRPERQTE